MKSKITLTFLVALFFSLNQTFAGDKKVNIICSESDAQIFQDGKLVGTGSAKIKVLAYSSTTVIAKKVGFIDYEEVVYNDDVHPKTQKSITLKLKVDESYEASLITDIANVEVGLNSDKPEDKVWKIISEVISSNFDILEVTDKSSGYMRTSWEIQPFNDYTVRTRVIVKICSSGSVSCFKIKVISERALTKDLKAKGDEAFVTWNRLLKKRGGIVSEIQSRI